MDAALLLVLAIGLAVLGMAMVSNDRRFTESCLSKIVDELSELIVSTVPRTSKYFRKGICRRKRREKKGG